MADGIPAGYWLLFTGYFFKNLIHRARAIAVQIQGHIAEAEGAKAQGEFIGHFAAQGAHSEQPVEHRLQGRLVVDRVEGALRVTKRSKRQNAR